MLYQNNDKVRKYLKGEQKVLLCQQVIFTSARYFQVS